MQKAILVSIKPQHVVNILSGIKTIELRKSVPENFEGWVYIYCTKSKPEYCHPFRHDPIVLDDGEKWKSEIREAYILNGKIVARFWLSQYLTMYHPRYLYATGIKELYYDVPFIDREKMCLENHDIQKYGNGKKLYGWIITKLEVFDKQKLLSDFYKNNHYRDGEAIGPQICTPSPFDDDDDYQNCLNSFKVKKAPQSWIYIWINE